ncbi:MAG: Rpn family recombination-promoting nuclease/putative transposase [Lachnospiraceae bacterium]|nr:Rpn family recombination-promoting nuclease/putative transposase [Lachnospiraceae bacterium]
MADTDTLTKKFVKDREVFADAFNYFLHDGKNVIKPEQLKAADTTEVVVPYGEVGTGVRMQPVQKIRDAYYSVMTEGNKVYMLCGIENQTEPHNAMPVRNALYDMMEYVAQIQEAAKAHRDVKNRGKEHDFLSGFHSTDKLIPVYTLVVYWGEGEWNAPKSLFEMLDVEDESEYYGLNDWKLNLIIPNELSDEDVTKFNSDLGKALIYIKNMGKPDKIEQLSADERFRVLKTDTVLLLNQIMNTDFQVQRKEKVTDMCYAIEKIKEEAAREAAREASISATINTARRYGIDNNSIMDDIIKQFSLTVEEAENYMAIQTA